MKKLEGSSLIEVTIAAVILVVVFLMVSMLIASLWKSGMSERKLYAHSFLQKMETEYKGEETAAQYNVQVSGLQCSREVEPYKEYSDIQLITFSLKDTASNKLFDQIKFLYRGDAKN